MFCISINFAWDWGRFVGGERRKTELRDGRQRKKPAKLIDARNLEQDTKMCAQDLGLRSMDARQYP